MNSLPVQVSAMLLGYVASAADILGFLDAVNESRPVDIRWTNGPPWRV